MKKILHLTKKEFIQTLRDKKMIPVIFIAPILQLLLLGYAVTTDVKHIYVKIWDMDKSQQSRSIINSVANCGYFDYAGTVESEKEIEENLKGNKCDFVLFFPSDYSKKIKRMEKARFQVIADGSDSNLTLIGFNYINEIVQIENSSFQKQAMSQRAGFLNKTIKMPKISPEIRIRYNPELKSSHYMVPGVICLILALTTMLLTSMALTKEKELGTIEQIIVSPIKSHEIIIGKTMPFVVIGMMDVLIVVGAGIFIFNIPMKGDVLLLLFSALVFILSTLGIGLFISTISRTQQQAMLSSFMFIFPAMMLSGFAFPVSNMPLTVQYLSYLIPLRYFLIIIRGIFLKGNGLSILWPQILALILFGTAILGLSALRFRKKLG